MLVKIPILVLRAGNCYNAYSPEVDGCMATGATPFLAVEKFVKIAGNGIRHQMSNGLWTDNDSVLAVLRGVDVPDKLPEETTEQ